MISATGFPEVEHHRLHAGMTLPKDCRHRQTGLCGVPCRRATM